VRELTYFNIGELSIAYRKVIDMDLYRYTSELIQSSFGHHIGKGDFKRSNQKFNGNISDDDLGISVIFNHLELGEG